MCSQWYDLVHLGSALDNIFYTGGTPATPAQTPYLFEAFFQLTSY